MKTENNPNNHYLDRSIVLFFIITILITTSVFSYKYINYFPCDVVDFEINTKSYRVGDIIRFRDNTQNVLDRVWDFGDNSYQKTGIATFHTFEKPGEYQIKLKVNGKCESVKTITIKEKAFILDSSKLARFNVPETIKVGEVLKIQDETKDAYKWEWRFGETAEVNSTDKNPEYTYESPGLKTIILIVNGNSKYKGRKQIEVLPKEKETRKPKRRIRRSEESKSIIKYIPGDTTSTTELIPIKRAPNITDKKFKDRIENISKKRINDVEESFSKFLCGNLQLPIIAKGKKTTFAEFCEKIRGRTIKIKELKITRNPNTNCIEHINIDYRKSLF
ncbi:PKD domain-containing protein [Ascidiimonas sp. W6]|uniref:PKD domain-containing protein n=1 Tax=Ascidiimonas meishanensis TaxID=3128903 RepID=UPI0030EB5F5B